MRTCRNIIPVLFSLAFIFVSCQKEDTDPVGEVQPQNTGDLIVNVSQCDLAKSPDCREDLLPLSGALVEVLPNDEHLAIDTVFSKLTLADGRAEFANLKPGKYLIKTKYIDENDQDSEIVLANSTSFYNVIFLK